MNYSISYNDGRNVEDITVESLEAAKAAVADLAAKYFAVGYELNTTDHGIAGDGVTHEYTVELRYRIKDDSGIEIAVISCEEEMNKNTLSEMIAAGSRNLDEFYTLREGGETVLCVHDFDRQTTAALDAEEITGEAADDIYARAVAEAKAQAMVYSADRDPNRFSIWHVATDAKDGYKLYVILDNEADELFFADGPSASALYTDLESVLTGFFGVAND